MGYSRKKLNLTGHRYGKLMVLAPAANVGGRTAWLCRCDCGREAVVKTYHLRCGHTKTCGCGNGAGGPRHALGLSYMDGTCVEMLRADFEEAVKARKRAEEELHDKFIDEYRVDARAAANG